MNAVMLRIHAEQDDSERHIKKITRGRAAIIKGYLIRRHRGEEEYKEVLQVSINEESKNKAYVLGRLFAILEKVQLEAIQHQYTIKIAIHLGLRNTGKRFSHVDSNYHASYSGD